MKPGFFHGVAIAAALALTACGSGGANKNVDLNASLEKVAAPNNAKWSEQVATTPEGGYRMGNPDAPVKLVEYASISCHVCAEFSEAGHEKLVGTYVESGQVSWEYRPFLLFPTDPGMFTLLRCQGAQPFYTLVEQLYATQSEWTDRFQALTQDQARVNQIAQLADTEQPGAIVKAIQMDQFFRRNGMNAQQVDACLADPQHMRALTETLNRGKSEGVSGTPTFFINGERAGVTSWSALEPLLREKIG